MKTKLFLTTLVVCCALSGFAQTKGTNTLGFGINTNQSTNGSSGMETKTKQNTFSLGYGHFINDNQKIGVDLLYSNSNQTYSVGNKADVKGYGANVSYQKYFLLVKTFYAYAGGRGGYFHSDQTSTSLLGVDKYLSNSYSIGAYGGLTWFLSKRFVLETSLLSANMLYGTTKSENNTTLPSYSSKQTSFNLSTDGIINDLGFKIFILG